MRNQHPAQLLVQSMPPRSAAVLAPGATTLRADAAYSNLFLFGSSGGDRFGMDGEYLRAAATAAVGLGGGLELGLELPVAHTSGGFLDSFVIDYHDLFGFPDQGRQTSPKDRFEVFADRGGQTVWQMRASGLELLDVPLTMTWAIPGLDAADGAGFRAALRAGIELPTGNDERGYGNGELDTTLGAVVEHRCERATLYGHVQHTFAGTPSLARRLGFAFRDVTAAGVGAELPLGETVSGHVQVAVENSTLRALDLRQTGEQVLLWVGLAWRVDPAWTFEGAFGEDLVGHVSPDFSAWLGVTWRPGR